MSLRERNRPGLVNILASELNAPWRIGVRWELSSHDELAAPKTGPLFFC
jgi:hypothetical protein